MFSVTTVSFLALTSAAAILAWKGLQFIWYQLYKSQLRHLRGPKGTSLVFGNMVELMDAEDGLVTEKWVKEYGSTLRYKGFLNEDQLLTMDTRATNHILTHSNDYQKPPYIRRALMDIFGNGILVVEGMHHRQQRRILNPAFGPAQIRALTLTFLEKALRLRDVWSAEIVRDPTATIASTRIDVMPWLSRVSLDIIGLTGFNYDFNMLDSGGQPNVLNEAFSTLSSEAQNISVIDTFLALFPVLSIIPRARSHRIQVAQQAMTKVGMELLTKAKAAAVAGATEEEAVEKQTPRGRDLLSLLVKANMADTSESHKLSDKDVVAQVPTFLLAGHETTSAAVAWALYALTQAPEVQSKLREELLSVESDTPSMDELMGLPYLDAVVRETLRVHSPILRIARIAMKDDVLPLEKPYTDRYGVVRDTITIAKGDEILIPVAEMNRSEELWGPDALEFRPERWNNTPEAVSHIPGVWSHLLTFAGGPRACIGYRFAIVEIKATLFTLVRAFEFALAVSASDVTSKLGIAQHPMLRSDPTHQPQLPMLVKPYREHEQ